VLLNYLVRVGWGVPEGKAHVNGRFMMLTAQTIPLKADRGPGQHDHVGKRPVALGVD